jgi:hypothetical protein
VSTIVSTQSNLGTRIGEDKQGTGADNIADKLKILFLTKYRLENCMGTEVEEVVESCQVLTAYRKASQADQVIKLWTHLLGTGSYGQVRSRNCCGPADTFSDECTAPYHARASLRACCSL